MDVVWIFESLRFCEIKMRFNTEHNFCVTLASQRSRAAIVKRERGGGAGNTSGGYSGSQSVQICKIEDRN